MERNDYMIFVWMGGLYAPILIAPRLLPPDIAGPIGMTLGFMFMVVGLFGQEYILQYQCGPYLHLEVTERPTGNVYNFFCTKDITTQQQTSTLYSTTLPLAYSEKVAFYGTVKKIHIIHTRTWDDRVKAAPGKAKFKGYIVKHPHTAKITVYTYPHGSTDVDHAKAEPVYSLKEAPGDYNLPDGKVPVLVDYQRA